MFSIRNMKNDLEDLVNALANITNVEFAIFDTKAHLIASTLLYQEFKGKNVHSASIEEVLLQGNVVVNKPGYMKSCIGCRFANNCPSTIEMLSCVKVENVPVGVVSLTSFTKEGHELISLNIHKYMQLLENTTNLISMIIMNKSFTNKGKVLDKTIEQIVQDTKENILVINDKGIITYCNPIVQMWFSFCDLYTKTIYQLFPEEVTNWLLDEKPTMKKYITSEIFSGTIYSVPIIVDDKVSGYIIKMEKEEIKSPNIQKKSFLDSIITSNIEMQNLRKDVLKIADSPSTVLISGETGTGKEMFAKAIHYSSERKNAPFIPINCANIPDTLFESELFGYEEGAFTGARKGGKPGLFEIASGGTIFLDEIGELPLYLQSKLLRVLQEDTIHRLGSTNFTPVNVRVIAATNKDLEEMVKNSTFREDLYYRLNVIPMHIPPLKKRREDIEILALHFVEKYSNRLNKNIYSISKEALSVLSSHNWPGNVRELENAIEYAVNMEEKNIIRLENLPNKFRNESVDRNPEKSSFAHLEYNLIKSILDRCGWDVKGKEKAAEELGISLRTLYRKLKEANMN